MTGADREGPGVPSPRAVIGGLYRAHRQKVYAYLWSRTGNREDALDLLQEVFLRAWRHADALAAMPAERRAFWLFASVRTVGIDHDRHRRVVARVEQGSGPVTGDAHRGDPGRRAEERESWRRIDEAVRGLAEPLREVLVLRVVGEMRSAEIGAALGVPAATVRYRLMRAREMLRRALALPEPGGSGQP